MINANNTSCMKLCGSNNTLITLKFNGCTLNDLIENPELLCTLKDKGLTTVQALGLKNAKAVDLQMNLF